MDSHSLNGELLYTVLQYKNAHIAVFLPYTGYETEVKQWKPFCKLASKSVQRHPLFLIFPRGESSAAEDGKLALFVIPIVKLANLNLSFNSSFMNDSLLIQDLLVSMCC